MRAAPGVHADKARQRGHAGHRERSNAVETQADGQHGFSKLSLPLFSLSFLMVDDRAIRCPIYPRKKATCGFN